MARWFLQNFSDRLSFGFSHPSYAFVSLLRNITLADERFIADATERTTREIASFLHEPFNVPWFANHLKQSRDIFDRFGGGTASLYGKKVLIQYAMVRAIRPDNIVETGVANGVSSAYLLLALEQNNKGTLHSVGVFDPSHIPVDHELGWLVPEQLRQRWHLLEGQSEKLLPGLLQELGKIDIFIHDSLHTYQHMLLEFQLAYPHLREGGFLLSDDVLLNSLFQDFVATNKIKVSAILRGIGVLKKN